MSGHADTIRECPCPNCPSPYDCEGVNEGSGLLAENQRLREALKRVKRNAESWHGTNPREANTVYGQQDALDVIAEWCAEALAGEDG